MRVEINLRSLSEADVSLLGEAVEFYADRLPEKHPVRKRLEYLLMCLDPVEPADYLGPDKRN